MKESSKNGSNKGKTLTAISNIFNFLPQVLPLDPEEVNKIIILSRYKLFSESACRLTGSVLDDAGKLQERAFVFEGDTVSTALLQTELVQ